LASTYPPRISTAALISQLCIAQLAAAQQSPPQPPSDAPAPAAPSPTEQPEPVAAAAETPARKSAGEEIVITGTRIRRKDLTTPAPISVINRTEIQASGRVSISDFLQLLPEQGNALNTSFNNGGNGSTRVSLRSLGTPRTLVLVNGRRYVPGGNGADASVDLNSIPSNVIERVEVLKDGASAIYGSDAIAGVINLITRKRMNGTELAGFAGTSSHGDGTIYDLSVTMGRSNDSGSLLLAVGYYTQKAVFAGDRNFSKDPYAFDATGSKTPDGRPGAYRAGSQTVPEGSIFLTGAQIGTSTGGNSLYKSLITACQFADGPNKNRCPNIYIRDPNATGAYAGLGWRPYAGSLIPPDGDGYNFQPRNYLVTPQERISLYTTGDAKLGNLARGYLEGTFVKRTSDQQLAPEPLTLNTERIAVDANNYYNPFGKTFQPGGSYVQRRLMEFGDRRTAQDIITIRLVAGIDGTLPEEAGPLKGWFWDVSFNYGRTQGTVVKQGNLKKPGLMAALGPSWIDASGIPHCGTSQATDIPGCVPLNLFGGVGSITPDQTTGLTFTGTLRGTDQLAATQINTSGELFRLFAERPIGLALGYEYRIVSGENIPDPVTAAGETTGNKSDLTRGHYYVHEGYGELSIPVVSGMLAVQELEATAAARVFDYNTFGSDITYKFGGRWTVIPDFTVRGTYSTGFRAPSIDELFRGNRDSFPGVTDPCARANAPSSCGAAANNGDLSVQLRAPTRGNPALKPETAKIFTTGVVLEPRFVRNLTVTADYYNIKVEKTITTLGAGVILASCYPSNAQVAAGIVPLYCDLIERDPASQRITNIFDQFTNIGSEQTAGIDVALNYALPTEYGRFAFIFDGTWLQKFNRRLADGTLIKARGNYDLGNSLPAWKFISGLRWGLGGFGAGANMHFVGSFQECGNASGDFSGGARCFRTPTYVRRIPAYSSYDLFASYALNTSFGKTTFTLGVNNIFDKQPPFIYAAGNSFATSDPSTYADGYIGRFVYGRLAHAF
jgi:iron complex outermembrane recepter protein